MKLSKKSILFFVLILLLMMGAFFLKEYERRPTDVTSMQATVRIAVADIIDLYDKDEAIANKLFLDKTIQVKGLITEILNQQDTLINIFLGDKNGVHKVSCLLDKRHFKAIKNYTVGQQISIKGICTGYLIDVELNRCVVVDSNE